MNKSRKRYNRYRSLKTISYLLGFPLMILFILIGSVTFYVSPAFDKTWYYGAAIGAAIWVVVVVLQLIFALICKKKSGRAIFGLVISLIFTLGAGLACDMYFGKNAVEAAAEEAATHGVALKNYNYQINHYITVTSNKGSLTDEYNGLVNKFCSTYNVGVEGKIYGKNNADKTDYVKGEDGAYYSPNGMYADGYVYGMNEAVDILITIKETQAAYKKKGKNADEELKAAIEAAKNSSAWNTYTNSKEYQAAYNETNGTAWKYMISEARLNGILSVLGAKLGEIIDSLPVAALKDLVYGFIPKDMLTSDLTLEQLVDYLAVLLDITPTYCPIDGYTYAYDDPEVASGYCSDGHARIPLVTLSQKDWACPTCGVVMSEKDVKSEHCDACNADHRTLTCSNGHKFAKVPEKAEEGKKTLADTLKGLGIEEVSKDGVMNFLYTLVYYQSPTTKPIYDFIKDETLKKYGYAKYYATTHGGNVGSILMGENLGLVSLSDKGYPSAVFDFSLNDLYKLRAYNTYVPKYYPVFAARRYLYVFSGVIALMTVLYFHFGRKQQFAMDELMEGGNR